VANYDETDCKTLAVLKADLSHVPHSEFELVNGSDGQYYKISYDIVMHFEAAISFRLVINGKTMLYDPSTTPLLTIFAFNRQGIWRGCCGLQSRGDALATGSSSIASTRINS
jgi:hypothetical protein